VLEHMAGMRYSEALQGVWDLVRAANRYIDDKKPWELKKNPERRDELSTVFNRLLHVIRNVVLLAYPVIPGAAGRVWQTLALPGAVEEQTLDALSQPIPAGHRVNQSEVLFQRVDAAVALGGADAAPAGAKPAPAPTAAPAVAEAVIGIDDFAKLKLRVGEIRAAERVAGADKLLKLSVFDGERERTVVAGIALHYTPEELVGQQAVLLCNLAPRKLRGLVSEGMLLAASDDSGALALLRPARGVLPGAKIS
jgi:methionyl-tRNA synthetase